MIKDFQQLPTLAKWFLQSSLERIDVIRYSETNAADRSVLLESQKLLVDEIFNYVWKSKEEKKTNNAIEYIVVNGDAGVGKSTIMKHFISKCIEAGVFSEKEVLCVSVKEHNSEDSFYSLCSNIARSLNLRKDSAALEELEGSRERKDVAVLNVLRNFRLVFFDDIDADEHEIWENVLSIIKDFGQSLLVVGTSLSIRKDYGNLNSLKMFSVNSISEAEVRELYGKLLHIDVPVPDISLKLANGIPSNICIISSILNHNKNASCLLPFSTNGSVNDSSSLCTTVIAAQLDCRSKYLLAQLCKIRRPIPVKDVTLFNDLLNYGLAVTEYQGEQALISVPSSVQKVHEGLITCNLQHDDFKNCSATELWKDIMSPKLKEILIGCQTENWTFVPESWNSVKDVGNADRYNINDLINKANTYDPNLKEYDIILECLYHAVLEKDFTQSVALIFLIDRYTFWTGTCKAALSVLSYIEKECPIAPVPPQVVIRKARVLKNDGDIQEAVKVLDLVINNNEGIGSYRYNTLDDAKHVTALCVSIKGDILRGLGLWKEAAETLIKSIDLTNALQRIEKKIISGSMAHLADTFRYMSIGDYKDVAQQLKLVTGHPLREAIRYATEAAQRCIFTPLFYLKNKRRAGDLSLIISGMLPDDENKYQYLENAAHEFREGLRCHDSISRLESKDQFYEFILAIQRLSLICKQNVVVEKIGKNIGLTLEKLAKLLYEHHCLFPQQIKHTEYSKLLVNLALSLVDLPAIPLDDNLEMLNIHVPVVEVKPNTSVKSLMTIKDERIEEITNIIDVSGGNSAENQPAEQINTEILTGSVRDEDTVKDSKEDLTNDIRNALTITDSASVEGCVEERKSDKSISRITGAIGAISRAVSTHSSTESTLQEDKTAMNIRNNTTVSSLEDGDESSNELQQTRGIELKEQHESIRSLRTASTTVDQCYATAEDESVNERNVRVKGTINTLEASDKVNVNWQDVEKLYTGMRLPSDVHRAFQWVYDVKTDEWSKSETLAYIGEKLILGKKAGACRDAFNIEFLEQDDPLRKYIGKQYKLAKYKNRPRLKKQYQQDILCQSLSRYYATLFNKALYQNPEGRTIGQVQFLPAVLLEIIDIENEEERYYNVEPFIAGDFVKISNNFSWTVQGDVPGKELLMAFSHFSYFSSSGKLLIVDIQGWTSEEKGGQTYLTDPQIHTLDKKGFGTANRGKEGFLKFWTEQHPSCTDICKLLQLDSNKPNIDLFQ